MALGNLLHSPDAERPAPRAGNTMDLSCPFDSVVAASGYSSDFRIVVLSAAHAAFFDRLPPLMCCPCE